MDRADLLGGLIDGVDPVCFAKSHTVGWNNQVEVHAVNGIVLEIMSLAVVAHMNV